MTHDELVREIADIIERNGESILNDEGVDRGVCLGMSEEIIEFLEIEAGFTMTIEKDLFKVVRVEGSKLFSVYATGLAQVEYKIHRWIQAPEIFLAAGYGLAVFLSYADAETFCEMTGKETQIYKALGYNRMGFQPNIFTGALAQVASTEMILQLRKISTINTMKDVEDNSLYWPAGTAFFEEIRLQEKA